MWENISFWKWLLYVCSGIFGIGFTIILLVLIGAFIAAVVETWGF